MTTLKMGELFAGYGGLGSLGIGSVLPVEPVWFCEFDKAPSAILAHHWPDVPNLGDITAVDWSSVEPVDVLTGGFPCQDVSHAGRRAGLIRDGEGRTRSGLWGHMLRAVTELRPALVVAENVRGLLSARADSDVEPCPWCLGDDDSEPAMRALGAVLADLADVGYDAAWYGLRAADVGAAHGRFRVFIFAWPATDADGPDIWDTAWQRPDQADGLQPRGDGLQGDAHERKAGVTCSTTTSKDRSNSTGTTTPSLTTSEPIARCVTTPSGTATTCPASYTPASQALTRQSQAGSAAGDLTLLPTPAVNDMGEGKTVEHWDAWTATMQAKHGNGNGHGKSLAIEAQRLLPTPAARDWKDHRAEAAKHRPDDESTLNRAIAHNLLPTPRATDGTKGGPNQRGSSGDLMLPSAVHLLPTPQADHRDRSEATGRSKLDETHDFMDLGSVAATGRWGDYAAAIARWESVIGRPAPEPTEPGPKGNPRLSAHFVEWLMGLPAGHVTDPAIGLSRNHQLKALGNGVVPQQAAAATRWWLAQVEGTTKAVAS